MRESRATVSANEPTAAARAVLPNPIIGLFTVLARFNVDLLWRDGD